MRKRFMDERQRISDFTEELLVVCPECQACAHVAPREPGQSALFDPRRLVCPTCGHIKEWDRQALYENSRLDWHTDPQLWLRIPCCGEVLWAFNWRHLQFIEDYVGAVLREHKRDPALGWSNQSMANRLPKWLNEAKNREEVLKAITRLRGSAR